MIDKRDPESIGQAIAQLKQLYPDKTAIERADMVEQYPTTIPTAASSNGK
jgi:hypothetical protein